MKFTLLIFTLLALLHKASCEESAFNLASRFEALPIEKKVASNLPKGRENDVIQSFIQLGDDAVLLRINHRPTIEKVIQEYYEKEGKTFSVRAIGDSGSPYLIEMLAPCLYKGDEIEFRTWGDGHMDYGESTATALLIGKLLTKSPEFSDDVKKWANQWLTARGPYCISAARQFWELNQVALKAQEFDKVTAPVEKTTPLPKSLLAIPQNPAITPVLPANLPPHTEPPQSQATTATKYWWMIGILLAVIGAFFVIKRKVKSV